MDKKIFLDNCITLDGRLDEAVWNEVPESSGFTTIKTAGGENVQGQATSGDLVKDQTFVKILPCENRVYFGIKCMEPNIAFAKAFAAKSVYTGNSVEVFLSPSNSTSELYNFLLTADGLKQATYFVEGGNNREFFKPLWNHAVYFGEDYWSAEIEIPFTALYYTPNATWSDQWLVNVVRNQPIDEKFNTGYAHKQIFVTSTWCETDDFLKAENFRRLSGMPIRPLKNDVKFNGVNLELDESTENGYCGTIEVLLNCATSGTFEFTSTFSEPTIVTLQPGANVASAPCCVKELIRHDITMAFKRVDDGELFRYGSTVTAQCEPIRVTFTQPEYRTNFYPGQDSSRIVGKVFARKPVTLKLEGGGMKKQVITPDAEGNFTFETPDFQKGTEAILTATIDGWEIKKIMRNLVPNGHTMAWISGGKLIIDGKPVFRRNVCAPKYLIGEAFGRRYYNDNLYETEITKEYCFTQPRWMISGAEKPPTGEATKDQRPSEEMLRKVDELLEENKDRDYVFHYIYDEPEYKSDSLVYMRHYYENLIEKDPYHPALIATHNPDRYLPYCDWLEPDPYLGVRVTPETGRTYSQPINTLHEFLDPVVQMNRPDKGLGFHLTGFAFKVAAPEAEYPTLDEYICHAWVAINHNVRTLWSYAGHDLNDRAQLYEGTRFVFSSVAVLEDVLLYADAKPLLRTDVIDACLYEYGEDTMFVVANMSAQPQTVTVDGISGTWYHFRHNDMITGNTFELKPFEVVVGTRTKKDEGLPSYAEVAELVDRQEAQRVSNKSLLFEREKDIVITLTDKYEGNWVKYKLFDGVRDNFACLLRGDTYLELNVAKIMPTFNKVVICGYCVEGAVVKARIDGELKELKPREVQNEEFSTTLLLDEPVCTDLLHFEFPAERVELYEIELY